MPLDALGQVLIHECLFILGTETRQNIPNYPDTWDDETRLAEAVTK